MGKGGSLIQAGNAIEGRANFGGNVTAGDASFAAASGVDASAGMGDRCADASQRRR